MRETLRLVATPFNYPDVGRRSSCLRCPSTKNKIGRTNPTSRQTFFEISEDLGFEDLGLHCNE